MIDTLRIYEELKDEITPSAAKKIAEAIGQVYNELLNTVTKEEFRELKKVVQELAEAQKRTEQKVEELAEAQKRTEQRVEELAEAQRETQKELSRLDKALTELAEAQKRTEKELARGMRQLRKEIGGLGLTMSYAFENEAFRLLPGFLKERFGVELEERLVRAEIGGKEINIFGKARKDGKLILIVGESKLRLDERKEQTTDEVIEELEEKVSAVKMEYGDVEILRLLITHYATKGFIREAEKEGIVVIQSFEW